MPDSQRVKNLFKTAAKRYNFVNSVLSLGQDFFWRRKTAQLVCAKNAKTIVDLATGSGVLAFAIAREYERQKTPYTIKAFDFCEELLEIAKKDNPFGDKITFSIGDALALSLPDQSADAISVAFGLRNFESRTKFYAEAQRILKPGGSLFILEFSQPIGLMRPLYRIYENLLPGIASLLGQEKASYEYLRDSVKNFPDAQALSQELTTAGFVNVKYKRMSGGVVALHMGEKHA